MKVVKVLCIVFCCMMSVLPIAAEQDTVFGRKLVALTDENIEALLPSGDRPSSGTLLSPEWRHYYAMRSLQWQSYPAWSPDGSSIAFAGHGSIFVMPVDGEAPKVVYDAYRAYEHQGYYITEGGNIKSLCFSPDGSEVFFETSIIDEDRGTKVKLHFNDDGECTGAGINGSIHVIKAVTIETGETRIVVDKAMEPQVSRDGRFLSYLKTGAGGRIIREFSTGEELIIDKAGMWRQCFSGEGKYLIFNHLKDQFYKVPITGYNPDSVPEQISFDENSTFISRRYFPDCSPDNRFVIFDGNAGSRSATKYDEDGKENGSFSTSSMEKLSVLSLETGLSYPLVPMDDNVQSGHGIFSPDGSQYCYARVDRDLSGGQSEIFIKDFTPEYFLSEKDFLQTSVDSDNPKSFTINGNFPNPFNPTTVIKFTLPEAGFANLTIYNVSGQKIRELVSEKMTSGIHTVSWDGRNDRGLPVSAGVYESRLEMGGAVAVGKMTLVK